MNAETLRSFLQGQRCYLFWHGLPPLSNVAFINIIQICEIKSKGETLWNHAVIPKIHLWQAVPSA
jgi:hypothetical protein